MTEALLSWYIIEKLTKHQCEMDNVGTAECFCFFTVSISAGLTFLICNVDVDHFLHIEKHFGIPLDLSKFEFNVVETR